jgi:LysM repeat protein
MAATSKLQTLEEAKASAPKPKVTEGKKLQTLEQAKASAPKPRGPMLGPEKPSTTLSKPAGKIASKVSDVKKAASSTKVGNVVKAVSKTTAAKSVASKASSVAKKVGKSKLVKGAGFVTKAAAAVGAARETGQVVSGQAEKDFRRIQALENRIAAAKGQKPKYTKSGSNRNLGESLKVDAGNALSFVGLGKSRKDRLAELKTMATKVGARTPGPKGGAVSKPPQGKKPVLTKGSNAPAATSGNKYRVNAGDTLSGIASRAGVSLKDLRASNPQITDPRKIYRNTGVVIPKGGKVPTGGYSKKAK